MASTLVGATIDFGRATAIGGMRSLVAMNRVQSRADRRTDAGFVALALAVGIPDAAAYWPHHAPWLGVAGVVLGTVACGALWLRRSHPLAVAVFAVTVAAFTPMAVAAAILAIATAGLILPLRTYARLGAYLGVLLAVDVVLATQHVAYASGRLYALATAIIGLVAGLAGRRQQQRQVADEQVRIHQARLAERARIAREMHDVLAHRISMVSVHAGALQVHPDAPAHDVSEAASVIRASAHAALGELRQVINLLRDPADHTDTNGDAVPPRPQPTLMDLPRLIEEARQAGTRVGYDLSIEDPGAVPVLTGRTVYRLVQEGLTNARKHAAGAAAEVAIEGNGNGNGDGNVLTVSVVTGPPARSAAGAGAAAGRIPGSGTGLVGLAERVALAGGRLKHAPTADGGYRLSAILPLAP
jgi:signal transduction histidine kinase